MKINFKQLLKVFVDSFKNWIDKDPFRESAAIAFNAIFSLPGLFVIIITLTGYFLEPDSVSKYLDGQITNTLGAETTKEIKQIVVKAGEMENSVWATILGIATILVGATGVFAQFQQSLNLIWEVKQDTAKSGIWNIIRIRLFSFGIIISFAFILIISLLISTLLSAFGVWLTSYFSESFLVLLYFANIIISLIILSFLFALMFKVFPDAQVEWKHIWIGSVVTAILFELGRFALSIYFGKTNPGTSFGAAGSIIIIMLWVSYSSMIVLYVAEFTHVYANMISGTIAPNEIAKKDVPK